MTDRIDLDGILAQEPNKPEHTATSNGSTESLPMVPFIGDREQATDTDEVGVAATAGASLESLYDKNQVLVYLVDISSSMTNRVAGVEQVSHFVWTDEAMEAIRLNAEDNLLFGETVTATGVSLESVTATEEVKLRWARISELMVRDDNLLSFPKDEESLMQVKMEVLRLALHSEYQNPSEPSRVVLTPDFTKMRKDLPSRLDLVKELAGEMIESRFNKYPNADIRVFAFREWPIQLPGHSKDEVLAAIRNLIASGGTNIMAGIAEVLRSLKHAPSKLNMHHIVLVTDAEDAGTINDIGDDLQTFKDFGIVLDFLHFTQPSHHADGFHGYGYDASEAIRKLCEATGGEYVKVSTADEFRSRFMIASQRLCLPAPVDS